MLSRTMHLLIVFVKNDSLEKDKVWIQFVELAEKERFLKNVNKNYCSLYSMKDHSIINCFVCFTDTQLKYNEQD